VIAVALAAHAVAEQGDPGGGFPMSDGSIDLSSWGRRADPFNSGLFNWAALDAEDARRRARSAP
jgi:hypothetical protein